MTETQPITHGGASDAGTNWMASAEVDWDLAAVPAWGDLKGLEGPYHRAIAALRAGKHVIFLGPPGSGKTELAEFICKTLQRTFRSVTATSEWSGFETIGGYLPSPDGEAVNGGRLDFNPGLVVQALEQQEWLVLDELNRADLDKCFGELFTLLGGGTKSIRLPFKRRGADGSYRPVVLAHSPGTTDDDTVVIPPSWRIIGTMNTTDKASLYQLSYAFMRRFAFINVGVPTPDQYTEIILAAIDREVTNGGEKAPLEALYDPIALMFAQNTSGTLRAAGIEFGPALALDVIRYVGSRSKQLKDPASLLEEALELLVFPQLEGMRQKYSEVISATGTALSRSLSDEAAASLRMWTGHYE